MTLNNENKDMTIVDGAGAENEEKVGLTIVEEDAFEECNSLRKVFYNGSEDEWRKIKNKSKEISNCTIVYLEEH